MKYLYLTVIAALVFLACQKELKSEADPTEPVIPAPTPEYVKTSIQGKVLDENRNPVAGSTVVIGKYTTTTNARGIFRLDSVDVDIHASVLKVSRSGYFNGFRTFDAHKGILNFVQVELMPRKVDGHFASDAVGSVTFPGGGAVVFPANSIVRADSSAYKGNVNVSAHFIDPSSPELPDIMPGDLRGLTIAGEERGLQSYGMMVVELTDDAGQKLQIAAGKPATLYIPIPTSLAATAPATIPMWWFDEKRGIWKEEGSANKQGTNYVGQVKHFSFWNCDAPFPITTFEAVIKTTNGAPLMNARVAIKITNSTAIGYGCTDSTGRVTGSVPTNQPLEIKVYDKCNTVLYTQSIGPFTKASNLGTITVPLPYAGNVIITGKAVNCSGTPVTKGTARISFDDLNYSAKISNGNFTFNIDRCNVNPSEAVISVEDEDLLKESAASKFSITTGAYDAGTLIACEISSLQYFNIDINGNKYNIVANDSALSITYRNNTNSIYTYTQNNNKYMSFNATVNATAPGTFPLAISYISSDAGSYNADPASTTTQMNFTEYGGVGKYATGTFSGTLLKDSTATVVNFSGDFRIKIK